MKINILRRFSRLLKELSIQDKPIRYFISRLFVNFPGLFSKIYFYRNGYKILMSANSITASFFVYGDNFLSYDEKVLNKLIKKDEFFIDVGANIGHLSISLANNNFVKVVAIEANIKTYNTFKKNIIINNLQLSILPLNYAVGEIDNINLEIQDSFADDCNSIIDISKSNNSSNNLYKVDHNNFFSVKAKTLDAISHEHNFPSRIRLLKIDVEGYELFVLKGSIKLLKITELIYFEYWNKLTLKYGYDKNELFTILELSGFKLFYSPELDEDGMPFMDNLKPILLNSSFSNIVNIIGININLLPNLSYPYR